MKKLKLTKVIASSLIVASILALNPIGASAEWRTTKVSFEEKLKGVEPKYWYAEGDSWATGWRNLDGGSGLGKRWFYFEPETGYAISPGWHKMDGKWYLFSSMNYMGACMEQDTITQDYNHKNYYYINSDGVWIENPPEQIKAYINLLQDREKMIKLGILISWEGVTDGGIIGSKVYFRDNVVSINLRKQDDRGYWLELQTEASLNGQTVIDLEYNNGMFIVDGKAYSNDEKQTTTKNIVEESGVTFDTISGKLISYRKDNGSDFVIPDTIGGAKVTSILGSAFSCCEIYNLKHLTIPETVSSVEKNAFKLDDNLIIYVYSDRLKKLVIDSGVKENKVIIKK